jgi:hypothetical protein
MRITVVQLFVRDWYYLSRLARYSWIGIYQCVYGCIWRIANHVEDQLKQPYRTFHYHSCWDNACKHPTRITL